MGEPIYLPREPRNRMQYLLPVLILSVVLVAGCTQYSGDKTLPDGSIQHPDGTIVKPDGTMVKPDGTMVAPDGTMVAPDGTMTKPDGTIVKPDGTMVLPNGTMIPPESGNTQGTDQDGQQEALEAFDSTGLEMVAKNYYRYDAAAFEQAKAKGYVVFLDFHANWCPICNAEKPHIIEAFNELSAKDVIGFEVHYNDGETKDFDTALAQQYQVPYQHTKILLSKNGAVVKKNLQSYGSAADVTSDIEAARAA